MFLGINHPEKLFINESGYFDGTNDTIVNSHDDTQANSNVFIASKIQEFREFYEFILTDFNDDSVFLANTHLTTEPLLNIDTSSISMSQSYSSRDLNIVCNLKATMELLH